MKKPVVDTFECIDCGGCIDLCPEVFRRAETGYIEVIDRQEYPPQEIDDVIKLCPARCIAWEEE